VNRIRILDPALADQIAAGEVVERPASVVKELVENALDAGARRVEVEIERGGLSRVAVSDDGHGMTPEEAHLALRRHATSKLAAIDDLFRLSTMGFRGEALPSIAAVSHLVLTTRPDSAEAGYRVAVSGGAVGEARTVGAPVGTRVEVHRLFYNVPARLKFMKTVPTESAHTVDVVARLALAFPQVHFRLSVDGRSTIDLPPHASGWERAQAALSRGTRPPALVAASRAEGPVSVEVYLGAPDLGGPTTRAVFLLVNRRFVRDRGLLHALESGYGDRLPRGRHPLAVLHLSLPPSAVDVNVHPQKLEVRLQRPQEVYAAVRHAVAGAVERAGWPRSPRAGEELVDYEVASEVAAEAPRLFAPVEGLFHPLPAPGAEGAPAPSPPIVFSQLTYLGQLDRSYLVCRSVGVLVLIDQHAASEAVVEARLRRSLASGTGSIPAERLLVASPADPRADAHRPLLQRLGFEIGEDGLVRAAPGGLGESAGTALTELLDQVNDDPDPEGAALAYLACCTAVCAGDALSDEDARRLLSAIDELPAHARRPHGRQLLVQFPVSEIERRLGARVLLPARDAAGVGERSK
jgi:DNA mismatch repair protein MutL